jgi:putative ABC transport system permease protein
MKNPFIFFRLAERNVKLNFLRSLLATMGIVIGVIAITSMGMLGANMQLSVTASLADSANTIIVSPTSGARGFEAVSGPSNNFLTDNQVRMITQLAGQNTVVPLYLGSDKIEVGSTTGRASIIGIDPAKIPLFVDLADGSNLRSGSTNEALVGATIASDNNLIIGSRIKIGDDTKGPVQTVRVVGILGQSGTSIALNPDRAIIVPDKWYASVYNTTGEYDQVDILVNSIEDITPIENAIDKQFNKKEDTVRITDSGQLLTRISSTLDQIGTFILLLGGISLIVAAVSIFNVMMMSVKDRIGEIGVLRSIGTTRGEVRRIFIYEALVLGSVGGLIGGLLSFVGGYLAVGLMLGSTDYFFSPASLIYIPYGMGIGIVVCLLSGLYPAWKAANLNPIDALHED